tara:strand:+ start:12654 stop:12890 length:237 start_codon:yes stop_codon:yes gene_type:complete
MPQTADRTTVDEYYRYDLRLVRKEIGKVKRILETHSQNQQATRLCSRKWDHVMDLHLIIESLEKITGPREHLLKGGAR